MYVWFIRNYNLSRVNVENWTDCDHWEVSQATCRLCVPFSFYMYCMYIQVHAELSGAIMHSGPQVATQLAVFWTGVHAHDFEVKKSESPLNMWRMLEVSKDLRKDWTTGRSSGRGQLQWLSSEKSCMCTYMLILDNLNWYSHNWLARIAFWSRFSWYCYAHC